MARPFSTDPAVKKSISIPTSLHTKMVKRMTRFGFRSESAYVQWLIRNDIVTDSPEMKLASLPDEPPTPPAS